MVAGVLGWMRKWKKRKDQNQSFFKGAASTLKTRLKKKLLDPVNWYKAKEISADEEKDKETARDQGVRPTVRRRKRKLEVEDKEQGRKKSRNLEPKSVLFCPFTPGGELAEENMEKLTGFKIKIVKE